MNPTVTGSSSQIAAALGIPAITAEAGGRGLVEEEAVTDHLNGLYRVLDYLGITPSTLGHPETCR